MIDFQPISLEVWSKKYANDGEESVYDTMKRVADSMVDYYKESGFYDESETNASMVKDMWDDIISMRFIPAGRIIVGAGTDHNVTMFNCFVSPTIEDDFDSIMARVSDMANTLRSGGGIGMDFSRLRPKGSLIKGTGAYTDGPIAFMDIWDAVCATINAKGYRKGAMMGVLRCDHPDIEDFIVAKRQKGKLNRFNISVGVTDEFIKAVREDKDFDLKFEGKVYKTVKARDLWEKIMKSNYDFAEPGVLFIDRINRLNKLWYCEEIAATNPCGEQPLPPGGACLLGSINLTQLVKEPFTKNAKFDFDGLDRAAKSAVLALHSVIYMSKYPLKAYEEKEKKSRRMGIGILGLGSVLAMLGIRYGSDESAAFVDRLMKRIFFETHDMSVYMADYFGPFEELDRTAYLNGEFWNQEALQSEKLDTLMRDIWNKGIAHSHLTSIAPNGNMSLFAGVCSNGIEPIFSLEYTRNVRQPDGSWKPERVQDYAWKLYNEMGRPEWPKEAWVTAQDLTVEEHMKVMAAAAPYVDSAISKTVNIPKDYDFEDFKKVYDLAYDLGLKGCTTYRPNDIVGAVLVADEDDKKKEENKDDKDNKKDAVPPRPFKVSGSTFKVKWHGNNYYITINRKDGKPFELFINSDTPDYMWRTAFSKFFSALCRREQDTSFMVHDLKKIVDPNGGMFINGKFKPSLLYVIAELLEEKNEEETQDVKADGNVMGQCPSCLEFSMENSGGCEVCKSCGYSKCG